MSVESTSLSSVSDWIDIVVYYGSMVTAIVVACRGVYLLDKNRHMRIIRARNLTLVTVQILAALMICITNAVSVLNPVYCYVYIIPTTISFSLAIVTVIARCILLYYSYNLTRNVINFHLDRNASHSAIIRKRKILTRTQLFLMTGLALIFHLVIAWIPLYTKFSDLLLSITTDECSVLIDQVNLWTGLLSLVDGIVIFMISRRLRVVKESLKQKEELRRLAYCAFVFIGFTVILNLPFNFITYVSDPAKNDGQIYLSGLLVIIVPSFMSIYVSSVYVVRLAKREYNEVANSVHIQSTFREQVVSRTQAPESFETFLRSDEVLEFRDFLAEEFSVENLLLWQRIQDYKERFASGASTEGRKNAAMQIYDLFCTDNEFLSANISGMVRRELEKSLKLEPNGANFDEILASKSFGDEDISPKVFDSVEQEIFKLMYQDSYGRFVRRVRAKSTNAPATTVELVGSA